LQAEKLQTNDFSHDSSYKIAANESIAAAFLILRVSKGLTAWRKYFSTLFLPVNNLWVVIFQCPTCIFWIVEAHQTMLRAARGLTGYPSDV
jgi:hypothetical protein